MNTTISPELENFVANNNWNWLPPEKLFIITFAILLIGIYGIVFNQKNFLITMMCIELTYLGGSFSFLINSAYTMDPTGQFYGLFLILLAAAEAAIGLGLLIVVYRYENSIDFPYFSSLAA